VPLLANTAVAGDQLITWLCAGHSSSWPEPELMKTDSNGMACLYVGHSICRQ